MFLDDLRFLFVYLIMISNSISISLHKTSVQKHISHYAYNFMDLFIFQVPMVAEKALFSGSLGVCGHWYQATLLNLVLVQI